MKKFNFSKVIVIGLLIVIASMTAITITARSYSSEKEPNAFIKVINDGTGTADGLLSMPGNFIKSRVNDFRNALNAFSQNQNLKKKLSNSFVDKQKLAALENENKQLRDALQLQESLASYKLINALVINRAPSSWNDMIIINKGSSSGLVKDTLVMSNGGIIGIVSQVNISTSKVKLLSNSDNLLSKIPIKIGDNAGFLMDFDKKSNSFVISNMGSLTDISKGNDVVTSGLDGVFPSDLMLGKVDKVETASSTYDAKIYVKPTSDFYNLEIVSVVSRQ
ncbi:MAG: rod shape-determining protein MreC [Streptococcaceae bacterium]|jgi:rod shape-determining protein MreC|nr:rod shape-determining protein MreC [Streptococcaceae bacterium]